MGGDCDFKFLSRLNRSPIGVQGGVVYFHAFDCNRHVQIIRDAQRHGFGGRMIPIDVEENILRDGFDRVIERPLNIQYGPRLAFVV